MDPTSSVGALLERDHERIDLLLTDFAGSLSNAAPDVETFTAAAHALRHHIYVEEEFHFPTVLEHGFEVQMLILIREHGQIWDALDKIETMLADPAVPLEHTMSAWRELRVHSRRTQPQGGVVGLPRRRRPAARRIGRTRCRTAAQRRKAPRLGVCDESGPDPADGVDFVSAFLRR
ncbi:MAG: hypothetical protein V9G04_18315 [Nocardioides sp.]